MTANEDKRLLKYIHVLKINIFVPLQTHCCIFTSTSLFKKLILCFHVTMIDTILLEK